MKFISVRKLAECLNKNDFQLLDVREPYEFKICALKCIHIPMGELLMNIDKLDSSKQVGVICKTGKRAAAVANLLETDFNFKNVFVVEGGIIAYAKEIDSSLEIYD